MLAWYAIRAQCHHKVSMLSIDVNLTGRKRVIYQQFPFQACACVCVSLQYSLCLTLNRPVNIHQNFFV